MMSGENNNRTTTKTNVVPLSYDAKRGFLQCKSMVFALQKYGFCTPKTILLQHKKVVFRKALSYK